MPATKSRSSPKKGTHHIPQDRATPGPYSVVAHGDDLMIVATDPSMPGCIGIVAQVFECDFPDQAEANARLFAAAPALLSILKRIAVETMDYPPIPSSSSDSWLPPELVQAALQALALVEGS